MLCPRCEAKVEYVCLTEVVNRAGGKLMMHLCSDCRRTMRRHGKNRKITYLEENAPIEGRTETRPGTLYTIISGVEGHCEHDLLKTSWSCADCLRAVLADASKALEAFRHDATAREAMERIDRVLKPAETKR